MTDLVFKLLQCSVGFLLASIVAFFVREFCMWAFTKREKFYEHSTKFVSDICSFSIKCYIVSILCVSLISYGAISFSRASYFDHGVQYGSLVVTNYNSHNVNLKSPYAYLNTVSNIDVASPILQVSAYMENKYKNKSANNYFSNIFSGMVNSENDNDSEQFGTSMPSKPSIIIDPTKPILVVFKFDEIFTSTSSVEKFENINKFVNLVINTFKPFKKNTEVALILTSGGGNALFFERAYENLKRLSTHGYKTYALIDTVCVSGCYMMACACDRIVASNSSTIGSIGVFTKRYNGAKLSEMIGVEEMIFKTSNKKGDVPFLGKADPASLVHVQNKIDKTMDKFTSIVRKGRPHANPKLFDADVHYAEEALKHKLVDEIKMTEDFLLEHSSTHNIIFVSEQQESAFSRGGRLVQSIIKLGDAANKIIDVIEGKSVE